MVASSCSTFRLTDCRSTHTSSAAERYAFYMKTAMEQSHVRICARCALLDQPVLDHLRDLMSAHRLRELDNGPHQIDSQLLLSFAEYEAYPVYVAKNHRAFKAECGSPLSK